MTVKKTIRGEVYKLVVMQVLERDGTGVPRKLVLLDDDESVHIKGGEEFITSFVPLRVLEGDVTQKKAQA